MPNDSTPHLYTASNRTPGISQQLINAIARGDTTPGGLAEAGWFDIGVIDEDGITTAPTQSD